MRSLAPVLVVFLSLPVTLAVTGCRCGKDESPAKRGPDATTPAASAGADDSAITCEPAYLGVDGAGVFELCAGQVNQVAELAGAIRDIEVGPTGTVWVSAAGSVWRVSNEGVKQVDTAARDALAVLSDDDVWAIGPDGVAHYTDGSWTLEPKDALGATVTALKDIAADGAKGVWVLSDDAVHHRPSGGGWRLLSLSPMLPARPAFQHLAIGPNGDVYASWDSGLVVRTAEVWSKVELGAGTHRIDQIATGAYGAVAALSPPRSVYLAAEGKPLYQASPEASGFQASVVTGVQLDESGRLWLSTDWGMVVLKDGKLVQQWVPGSVRAIRGRISQFVVLGSGPALPDLDKPEVGVVVGKIVAGDAPVVGAVVELCPMPSEREVGAPCDGAPFKVTAQTDPEGGFALPNVPSGSFGLAVGVGEAWTIAAGVRCCEALVGGGSEDLGDITVPAQE